MSRLRFISGLLVLSGVAGTATAQTRNSIPPPPPGNVTAPALEGPTTELDPIPQDNDAPTSNVAADPDSTVTTHDALRARESGRRTDRVHAPKPPPAPIAERPAGARPEPRANWIPGYWDWDPARAEFFWMGGVWQVPPPRSIWVQSRWTRDQNGWYRTPGFWSLRRGQPLIATELTAADQPAWRKTGPPADHPADAVTAAPGPDYFFVPGHYAPDGDQVSWKAGFWARSQPGWDWVSAHWVRRAAGWEFRAGHWVPEAGEGDVRVALRPSDGRADIDRPLPPPVIEDETDSVIESEEPNRVRRDSWPIVPGGRMPYYVIRPPGMFPYGPGGVVVPGVVPGFVRRMLDEVLP